MLKKYIFLIKYIKARQRTYLTVIFYTPKFEYFLKLPHGLLQANIIEQKMARFVIKTMNYNFFYIYLFQKKPVIVSI